MFYERLVTLCNARGITVTSLLKELNLSPSKGTAWKGGAVPKGDKLTMLADYFNVSSDYLLGNTDIKEKPHAYDSEGLSERKKLILLKLQELEDSYPDKMPEAIHYLDYLLSSQKPKESK